MSIEELDKWVKKYNIVKRTKACSMFVLENYAEEEPDKFKEIFKTLDINSLETKQSEIKLCYKDEQSDEINYVSSMLEIQFNGEILGYYACVFGLDGALKMVM